MGVSCSFNADFQPLHFPSQYFCVSGFAVDADPASCSADSILLKCIVIVVQDVQAIKAVVRKKLLHFLHGVPPVIMVAL